MQKSYSIVPRKLKGGGSELGDVSSYGLILLGTFLTKLVVVGVGMRLISELEFCL